MQPTFSVNPKQQYLYILTVIAFFVYLIISYTSVGYYHPDEHYQVLEFACYKLGKLKYEQLPWEYHYKIRSTFQPWIALGFMKTFGVIGLNNPYTIAFILRVLTASLSLYSIYRFMQIFSEEIAVRFRFLYFYLSCFLWFLPFINVRFSSETLSAALFLLALVHVLRAGTQVPRSYAIAALFCGLAFLCRFQCAFMILGLFLWLIFIRKASAKNIINMLLIGLAVVIFGIIIDSLFYGSLTISAWNYFQENIINDKASHFGIRSAGDYLFDIFRALYFPLGLIVVASLLIYIVRFKTSVITWVMLPLIVIHFIIPHKEVRFLFPLVNFLPLVIIRGLFEPMSGDPSGTAKSWLTRTLTIVIVFLNAVALLMVTLSPPQSGRIRITKYIQDHYAATNVTLYCTGTDNLFEPHPFIRQSYYELPSVTSIEFRNVYDIDSIKLRAGTNLIVLRKKYLQDPLLIEWLKDRKGTQLAASRPDWCGDLLRTIAYAPDGNDYLLYRIGP